MKTVGVFEGKTHFSALLEDAERGETIIVTKKGRPIAQIGPIAKKPSFDQLLKPLQDMKVKLGVPIREAINAGRKR
jgi:prevent-host-death family protein